MAFAVSKNTIAMRTSDQQSSEMHATEHASQSITQPLQTNLNQKVITELESLFDFVPPQRLSRKLRYIFLSYMHYERDLPLDIDKTIMDMQVLMEFLDTASDEG